MFNVFPFENTINVMFLSGREMQELFDFITERSTGRGCA
jgi:5'-nucleotidase/UDP-sugar diphosphatase